MKPIFVTEPALPEYDEYVQEIKSIWELKYITNFGPKYQTLVEMMKTRFGYQYVDMQCNGHMMLQNILSCIEPGEIITTPFTFVSTTLAILNSGHTPVFCDIDPHNYNIDINKIESLITDRTVAIVPVHVFGTPCDVDRIKEIADRHNLRVVYDAAHAFNVKVKGKEIGTYGNASMFSMHATKVYNTIEGGMGVFNEEELYRQTMARSNFGLEDGLTVYDGVNSKMNEFAAAMGIINLRHVDENIRKREKLVERYDSHLQSISGIQLLERPADVESNYAYYPIVIKKQLGKTAEELKEYLDSRDIHPRRYFYPSINKMPVFKDCRGSCIIAEDISENVLCLPLAASLTCEQVDYICDLIVSFVES